MRKLLLISVSILFLRLFAVAQNISVTVPNGGETFTAGVDRDIIWNASGTSGAYNVYYSTDGGSNWIFLADYYQSTVFVWNIPNISSNQCKVKVEDFNNPNVFDISDNNFTITNGGTNPIAITSPNGGESWYNATGVNITYTASAQIPTLILSYSTDGGGIWNYISTVANTGNADWLISGVCGLSNNCLIKLEDYNNPTVFDISDAPFNMYGSTYTLLQPNGGQVLNSGQSYNINWGSEYADNYVALSLSTDSGATWDYIYAPFNNGTYSWNVPVLSATNDNCLLKVANYSNNQCNDISDAVFTINQASIDVTYPNGGEVINANSQVNITWSGSAGSPYVYLYYSTDNGITWYYIASTPSNTGSYAWTVPSMLTSNQCLVKIVDNNNPALFDISANTFSINGTSYNIIQPNGGEQLNANQTYTVNWNSTNGGNFLFLYYSTNNGLQWNYITSVINTGTYDWPVPSLVSTATNCLFKIEDEANPSIIDISDNVFTINGSSINLNDPNGGENIVGGQLFNISWSSTNGSSNVYLYYSTNSGANWTYFATTNNTGSFNWNVPTISSCNVRIRIVDANNSLIFDDSDNDFCINNNPSITVTVPNGGEQWTQNTNRDIIWNSTNLASSNVSIDYSSDGGVNWTAITSSTPNNGVYVWNVNAPATCQTRIRVSDATNSAVSDISNANFCVIASTQNCQFASSVIGFSSQYTATSWSAANATGQPNTYPNYGDISTAWASSSSDGQREHLVLGFNSPAPISSVAIYETYNPGAVDTIFVRNASNGSWNLVWSGTATPAGSVSRINLITFSLTSYSVDAVRLAINSRAVSGWNEIDAVCIGTQTAANSITVVSPNGGEILAQGASAAVNWTSNGVANVNIEFSSNNGGTWSSVASNIPSTGTYQWNLATNAVQNCNYLIKISDATNANTFDVSNNSFCVSNPSITVTIPNGGEQWTQNTSRDIIWSSNNLPSSNVSIDYSSDGGVNWSAITSSTPNNGVYIWNVNAPVSCQTRIRVKDVANSAIADISNNNFCVNAAVASITLTTPNGGQNWGIGTQQYIRWSSSGLNLVKLEYSFNGGSTYQTIATGLNASVGSYLWTVPNTPSTICLVRVSNATNSTVNDVSNNYFTIPIPTLTLTTPNGGEAYGASSSQYIYWNANSVPNVKLEYSLNNGVVWNTITSSTNGYNGYFLWNLPSTASNSCKVRISSVTNPNISDVSNAVFSIINPSLRVVSPNGGEVYTGLSYRTINWTSTGASSYVNVYYSTDNGINWNLVASGVSNSGSLNWSIPNIPSTQYKVKVRDYYNINLSDESNNTFTVVAATPLLTVNTPNGGETLLTGYGYYINWSYSGVQNIKIEYSINNGSSWTTIASSFSASLGSYYWNVPNTPSNQARVRISDLSSGTSDVSNNTFNISQPQASLTLTTPNGGENWQIGSYRLIQWSSTLVNSFRIERTSDNGATWSMVAPNINASNGAYYYFVQGPASSQCRLRLVDNANAFIRDSSDNIYTESTPAANTNTVSIDTLYRLSFCKGDTLSVPYIASGAYNSGNDFEVQLSDSSGSFANPVSIGTLFSSNLTGVINAQIPNNILNGVNYRVRVVSSDLPAIGTPYVFRLTINSPEFDFTPSSQVIKYLPNARVQFTYQGDTSNVLSYKWAFGNGDTSALRNPAYSYNAIGFYSVNLTVTNNAGCRYNLVKPQLIDVEQIFPSIPLGNIGNSNNFGGVASSASGDTVYAVGANGTIISSYNGGASWNNVTGVPAGSYTGVTIASGTSSNNTYICVSGQNGYLAFSNNGGVSWNQVNPNNSGTNTMNDVAFFSNSGGIAVGVNGSLVSYNGSAWVNHTNTIGSSVSFNSAAMLNNNTAIVVGNNGTIGQFNISTSTWNPITSGFSFNINAVAFLDADTGYAVGDNGLIIKTTNAGTTWTNVFNGGISSNFVGLTIDTSIASVIAVGDDGVVYRSLAGGQFERYSIGNTANQRSISSTKGKGVIVGDAGGAFRFGRPDVGIGTLNSNTYCAGTTLRIPYNVSGQFNQGNVFTAQLSDANGAFTSPISIGSKTGNERDTLSATIPSSIASGTTYRIRIVSSDTALIGNDNGSDITILPAPQVALGADTTLCSVQSITLNAQNAGSTFLWNTGVTTSTISVSSAGVYDVTVTNSSGCSANDNININVINSSFNIDLGADINVCNNTSIVLDAGISGLTYQWNTGQTTQTINAINAGTYIVTASLCGFTDKDTVIINLRTAPQFTFGNDTTVCNQLTLSGPSGNGFTYLWYPGNQTSQSIQVAQNGMYGLTVSNSNGCSTSDLIIITVINSTGAQPIITQNGNTLTCSVNNANSYQWFNANGTIISGATSATYDPSIAGDYFVMINGGTNCDEISALFNYQPNSIKQLAANSKLLIYPNPANDKIRLAFELNEADNIVVKINSMVGQDLYYENIQLAAGRYSKQIDISSLSDGIYLIQVVSERINYTNRLIIHK